MKLFSAEDFCDKTTFVDTQGTEHTTHNGMILISWSQAAEYANAKFKAYLEAAPKVYGHVGTHASTWSSHPPGTFIQENNTHTARLIEIEPIAKQCEHKWRMRGHCILCEKKKL